MEGLMKKILCSMLLMMVGCTPAAYKVTPIPLTDELQESIVYRDKGILLPNIALIDIDGMIVNSRETGLLGAGENKMATVVEKLRKASEDPRVRGVVLRINSPGGSVTASDIIYNEVLKVRKGDKARGIPGKPVIASMMDVCASGGYYIACGCDRIVAEPTSVTGSIGVVMLIFNFSELMGKVGITSDAIKSGPMKDAGSPFRPMKPEERQLFQNLIDEFYGNFLTIVSDAREIKKDKLRKLADGRVYTGKQAKELGLIDEIGTLDDAINLAKQTAGVRSANVLMYHRPVGYTGSIYSSAMLPNEETKPNSFIQINAPDVLESQGLFMYLWQP
jgi:protease-4